MADPANQKGGIAPATIALALAGLLALAAIGIALLRPGDTVESADANAVGNAAAGPPTLADTIASLQQQLRRDPDNHELWYMLGLAHRDEQQFPQAERAFRRAMELAPQNPDYTAYLGEMLLLQGGATPPPEAERLFRRVVELQPANAQARYYLATLKDMRGDHRTAVDELLTLLREAPADAPWEAQVREAVIGIARRNNIDIASRLPPPRAPQQSAATSGIPGPTREQMDQARAIPPSQQDEMVKGMVDRLANRLRQNPRDEAGWVRLMRSRMVLNDRPAAAEALRSALTAFDGDAVAQQRLRTAGQELGVPGA